MIGMLLFVSEPVRDLAGEGASFVVGAATIRCTSMAEAVSLSQRCRAALQALARRGGRPRPRPGLSLLSAEIGAWIDELVDQSLALNEHSSPLPPRRDRDDFELPKSGRISDIG